MYQRVLVIGNLGGDPVMKYTPDGVPVTDFSVATSRKWKGADGEMREKTTWFRVTAWRKLAETCNTYLRKGRLVMVEGEVEASPFLGQDGQPRASLKLTARDVRFLGGRGEEPSVAPVAGEPDMAPANEEELPF